jgi:hypothetical protein
MVLELQLHLGTKRLMEYIGYTSIGFASLPVGVWTRPLISRLDIGRLFSIDWVEVCDRWDSETACAVYAPF